MVGPTDGRAVSIAGKAGQLLRVFLVVARPSGTPLQWGDRMSAGNSAAAAASVNMKADSRATRPAGAEVSPAHSFLRAAALSAPVTSHKRCRAASSALKVSV